MSSSAEFIFELSLSEKLQLVEDLWDDIASTPEAVPVHDWQRKNWRGENRIYLAIPAQRFPGKEFSAEFAVDMAVELSFAPEIEWDVLKAVTSDDLFDRGISSHAYRLKATLCGSVEIAVETDDGQSVPFSYGILISIVEIESEVTRRLNDFFHL